MLEEDQQSRALKKFTNLQSMSRPIEKHPEMVRLLIDHGADSWYVDDDGDTAFSITSPRSRYPKYRNHPLHGMLIESTGCHLVGKGDTRLSIIAGKALGDPARWPELAELNGLGGEKTYLEGDCLKVPSE